MLNGYIKLHRKMQEWGWYGDCITKAVFLDLLLNAAFKEGEYKGIHLKAGDVVIGRKALAERLGLTERQVRTALEHLKTTNEVTTKTTNRFTVATIVKWGDYQLLENENDQQNDQQRVKQATNKRPTNDQQTTTSKECKECKEEKESNNSLNEPTEKNNYFCNWSNGGTGEQLKNNVVHFKADAKEFYTHDGKAWPTQEIADAHEDFLRRWKP